MPADHLIISHKNEELVSDEVEEGGERTHCLVANELEFADILLPNLNDHGCM